MFETELRDRRVLVWGLGRFGGGLGVTRWLVSQGAEVTVLDRTSEEDLEDSVAALADLPVILRLGGEDAVLLDSIDLVIVNPAVVKWKSEFFAAIARRGLPWTTEINLFCARCPATVVGVTGSFGKSTTAAMLFDVLNHACELKAARFRAAHLGGNIGKSLLVELAAIGRDDVVVLELSNAQLEDLPRIRWAPACAVVTNLYPHHLDRYRQPEEYFEAKSNIARDPARRAPLITGPLDPRGERILMRALGDKPDRRVRVHPPIRPVELAVPGAHNRDNAACVLTTAHMLGIEDDVVRQALRTFSGLPHRLELVRRLDGVDYVNDSKSTAPSATIKALESFDPPIVLLVGGQRKDTPLDALALAVRARCRAAICFGESGKEIAGAVGAAAVCSTVADAVYAARRLARSGDVVLFSPGAPSFDAYRNYEERGRDFIRCVQSLLP